jgi:predicted Zn-dependent protease
VLVNSVPLESGPIDALHRPKATAKCLNPVTPGMLKMRSPTTIRGKHDPGGCMRSRRWKLWTAAALAWPVVAVAHANAEHLRVGDRVLRWSRSSDAALTTITYTVLTRDFVIAGDQPTLSPSNCASMQPFDNIVGASPEISPATTKRELQRAFAAWQDVANIAFVETTDPERADVVIGAATQQRGGAAANLSFRVTMLQPTAVTVVRPTSALTSTRDHVAPIHQAYVCLDPAWRWKVGFDGNLAAYDLRHTFIHEIGHVIGLDHPGRSGALMGFRYDEQATDLQPLDTAAVQALYGPPQREK